MNIAKDVREVYKAGGSTVLTLPLEFLKLTDIESGDRVEVVFNEEFLKVVPITEEKLREELEKREGDNYGERNKNRQER